MGVSSSHPEVSRAVIAGLSIQDQCFFEGVESFTHRQVQLRLNSDICDTGFGLFAKV